MQLSAEQKENLGRDYLGMSAEHQQKMSYKEWLKHKNAEQRLKQKLVAQAQDDIRDFLMQIQQGEEQRLEQRGQRIDQWLMREQAKQRRSLHSERENCGNFRSFKEFKKKVKREDQKSRKAVGQRHAKFIDDLESPEEGETERGVFSVGSGPEMCASDMEHHFAQLEKEPDCHEMPEPEELEYKALRVRH